MDPDSVQEVNEEDTRVGTGTPQSIETRGS